MNVTQLQEELTRFAAERDWEQFHSPKNLCMALAGEVGELIEHFQWLTQDESRKITREKTRNAIAEELADIFIYGLRLSHVLGIDIEQAIAAKMRRNEEKYPVSLARGNATKYSERE